MALTLDGTTTLPAMGGGSTGLGAGMGALGGGVVGLLLGSLLGNGNGLFGGHNGWGGGTPAATAIATDITLNPAFQSLQNQLSGIGDRMSDHNVAEQVAAVNANVDGTSRDTLNSIANLATAVAAGNFTTLSSINGLGRDLQASATQALINNLQNFNTLQGNLTTSTNQIITQGTANAAAMANCCCEIKSLITSDGNTTRQLINDLNVQNLRDQLNAANGKVSNNEQNQYLLSTILAHLKPIVV